MQVRKFEATTMRDAISAVKRELGANAVILSTKELPASDAGIPRLYEVTAAAAVSSKSGAEARSSGAEETTMTRDTEALSKLSFVSENMASARQLRLVEGTVHDVRNLLLDLIRDTRSSDNTPAHLFAIEQTLNASGVDRVLTAELLRYLSSYANPQSDQSADDLTSHYKDIAARWLMKKVKIAPKLTNVSGMTNVHVILGTPGSGKSTLISKIATAVSKKERHSVAILSWDPEKLGAGEQTRIYSKILGIEHITISRPEELKPAVMKLRNINLLLVDTAGRNPTDTSTLVDLEIIKESGLSIEFHLALSATEKSSLQDRAIRHFSTIGLSSVAFTKLDEVPAWGDVFNSSSKWSVPLSWLSWSSTPSQAPERASRETIVSNLLKTEL